jgi:hypothetical protein
MDNAADLERSKISSDELPLTKLNAWVNEREKLDDRPIGKKA